VSDVANRVFIRIEVELSGQGNGWTDITRDVRRDSGINGFRGFRGDNPVNRVAITGLLTFALINSPANSGGLDGYYSPGHTNLRSGFSIRIGARASLVTEADGWVSSGWVEDDWTEDVETTVIVLWTGEITDIEPTSGKNLANRVANIECRDYIDTLARHRLSGVNVAEGISETDAWLAVVDEMPIQPRSISAPTGPDTYDFAFDQTKSESTVPLQELQKIGLSSLSLTFVKADGALTYEPRNLIRTDPLNPLAPAAVITESDIRNRQPIRVEDNEREIINRVQGVVRPRDVDAVATILFQTTSRLPFLPGGPHVVVGQFTDASERSERIGGISPITPVSGVGNDFDFNEEEDGSGSDLTSSVTLSASFDGNSVTFTITNNSVNRVWGRLEARGTGVKSHEPVTIQASDDVAITSDGENPLTFDMAYQSDIGVAQEIVSWVLHVQSQALKRVRVVPMLLSYDDIPRVGVIANREISDVVSLSESMTAFDGTERFFLDGIGFRSRGRDRFVWMDWYLAVANSEAIWHLGVTDFSELGVNTHLGFLSAPFEPFATTGVARNLTTGGGQNNNTDYVTASILPTSNNLILAWVNSGRADSMDPAVPTVTGCSLTWVEVATIVYDTAGTTHRRLTLFRALGAAPTEGKVRMVWPATQDRASWSIIEFSGIDISGSDGSGAIVQSVTGSSKTSPISITLAAFGDAANRPALGIARGAPETFVQEVLWILLGRRTGRPGIMSAWRDAVDLSASASFVESSRNVGAIAVEVKSA